MEERRRTHAFAKRRLGLGTRTATQLQAEESLDGMPYLLQGNPQRSRGALCRLIAVVPLGFWYAAAIQIRGPGGAGRLNLLCVVDLLRFVGYERDLISWYGSSTRFLVQAPSCVSSPIVVVATKGLIGERVVEAIPMMGVNQKSECTFKI
ncbi:hypothetical protein EJB05_42204, partial [Eragrostis curvula]